MWATLIIVVAPIVLGAAYAVRTMRGGKVGWLIEEVGGPDLRARRR